MKSWAAIFPGQGSQVPGMGSGLIDNWAPAKERLQRVDSILKRQLLEIITNGPKEVLSFTENSQPAIFTLSTIYWDWLIKKTDKRPQFVAGHSLGEMSAIYASGAASFDEMLRLVDKRSGLMKKAAEKNPGKMSAVLGMDRKTIEMELRDAEGVEIANYNCPGQIVISGRVNSLDNAAQKLKAAGARKVISLPVSGAFHSSAMAGAENEFKEILEESDIKDPKIPVIGNVTAEPLTDRRGLISELSKQMTSSVEWQRSIEYMIGKGTDAFIEVGPQKVLTGLMARIDKTKISKALDNCDFSGDGNVILEEMIGA